MKTLHAFRVGGASIIQRVFCWMLAVFVFAGLGKGSCNASDPSYCFVCGRMILMTVYFFDDKVTLKKESVCASCTLRLPTCFLCGLPAMTNLPAFVSLYDDRVICARDAQSAVLKEEEGGRICREVRENLDRLLSRWITLPETNVTLSLLDRIRIQEVFKFSGNDYECPNAWGITETSTNQGRLQYHISVLSGLPRSWFEATCAHEYAHAWTSENVSASRRARLDQDAVEGFCELMSWLLVDSRQDAAYKTQMLRNKYTRGQIDLFIAANNNFGFNEVIDWMQYGTERRLSADDPHCIRMVEMPPSPKPATPQPPAYAPVRQAPPETIMLKAIFWDPKSPSALINGKLFQNDDTKSIQLGTTNVTVRCLGIRENAVRIQIVETTEEKELRLGAR